MARLAPEKRCWHVLAPPRQKVLTAYSSVINDDLATFLKLAGPALVQMFIGDGARLVRDAFALGE